ncbi:MAG: hypothetical protein M3452_05955 [Chloroflexota bacterium]|nr:hypothetical protein [Chloroflexota bacterium]
MRILSRLPFHPFLFAAYSVLFVYAANLSEVLLVDMIDPLGRALIVAGAATGVAALLFRGASRGALVATAAVVAFAFFGHLAPELERVSLDERAQLALWAVVVVAAAIVAVLARARLDGITLGLNTISLVLVIMTLAAIVPYEAGRAARVAAAPPPTDTPIAEATRLPNRDIYYLVFDRYGSDWSLQQRYGIDNDLPEWLAGEGFQVIPGARANYRATDFSLASTLNMRLLDELTERFGPVSDDRTPARQLINDHEVGTFLRANGYRYFHLGSWFGPTRSNPGADEVLTEGVDTEFSSVLHDTSIRPALDRLLDDGTDGEAPEPTFRERHRDIPLFQFRQLQRLPAAPGRKFVFAHILLPHPPYVFDRDGRTVTEEQEKAGEEAELVAAQLAYTNEHIRATVAALLSGPPESDPIIVIQADEGPFLCGNTDCVDLDPETLGIRLGVLGAYYLPDMPPDSLPATHSSVNTFRFIFREYFGADLPPLPDRSFTWPDNDHLYDFQDITDLLPLPGSVPGADP